MIETMRRDAAPILGSWRLSGKPAWMLWMRLLFMTPGFQLVLTLRIQRWLGRAPVIGAGLRRLVWKWTSLHFACDVDPQAIIAPGLYIPHPVGIVIGGGIRIGRDVMILQNVTPGRTYRDLHEASVIGASGIVNKDVPAGSIAVGVPARIFFREAADEARP